MFSLDIAGVIAQYVLYITATRYAKPSLLDYLGLDNPDDDPFRSGPDYGRYLYGANGLAVDDHDCIWAGSLRHVHVFDSTLQYARSVNAAVHAPLGIAFDKNNTVYIVDSLANDVLMFDYNGELVTSFGKLGKKNFPSPRCVACDGNGLVFISEQRQIQVVRRDGKHIRTMNEQNGYTFTMPSGLAVRQSLLYVACLNTWAIQV